MTARRAARWTAPELALLREHYPAEGALVLARLPRRSRHAIHAKANRLGLATTHAASAPRSRLHGAALDEAIRLRETAQWSFAAIGRRFGISEASACNAVTTAMCPRNGYRPAERDCHGHLTAAGLERLRYALKKGFKGIDIQRRLGVSAACVAEQRRRYDRELTARGKAPLPPPGAGKAYSGAKLSAAQRKRVEALFMQGLGSAKVAARSGVSPTSCTRIRDRLVRRLRRVVEPDPADPSRIVTVHGLGYMFQAAVD